MSSGIGIGIGNHFGSTSDEWYLGTASPLLWTRATNGITGGTQGTVNPVLTAAAPTGVTPAVSGEFYRLTADAGNNAHELALTVTTAVAGPMEFVVEATLPVGVNWLRIADATDAVTWFNVATGATGSHSGASWIETVVTSQGSGVFRCKLRSNYVAATTLRIGLANADGGATFNAVGTERIDVRVLSAFESPTPGLVQQRILDWADVRGNGRKWTQATAALQPFYWTDSRGPLVKFHGAQWMQADSLAAGFAGTSIPFWFACASDNWTRGATTTCMYSVGGGVGTLLLAAFHNLNATQSRASRYDDASADDNPIVITTTGVTQGVLLDRYNGVTRTFDVGAVTGSSAQSGVLATTHLTLGALRYAAGAAIGNYMSASVREAAIAPATLSAANAARAAATLKTRYGY